MKKYISAVVSLAIISAAIPAAVHGQNDAKQYTVTFVDFDGNEWKTLTVGENEKIDYTLIDTEELHRYKGIYTEQLFSSWDRTPETVTEDITIRALSSTATISLEELPETAHYFSLDGDVSLEGLSVVISVDTEVPVAKGDAIEIVVEKEIIDITKSCTVKPGKLEEVFADGNSAEVRIYPIREDKAIASYEIYYHKNHGDVNGNGRVDAVDASSILKTYSELSDGSVGSVDPEYLYIADIDFDGKITAADARLVLKYYTTASAGIVPDWNLLIYGEDNQHSV